MSIQFPEKAFARVTILLINLCAFFYIVSNDTLFRVFLISSLITVFIIILRLIIKNGLNSLKNVSLPALSDAIKLSKTYLKMNRRFILVATLGLILAIGAISQTLFYGRSVQVQLMDEVLENPEYSYQPPMKISMNGYTYWEGEYADQKSAIIYPYNLNEFLGIQADVNQAILDTESDIIGDHTFACQLDILARSQSSTINESYIRYLYNYVLVGIPQEQFSSLELPIKRGTLPNLTHPVILVKSTYSNEYYYDYDSEEERMMAEIERDLEIALYSESFSLNSSYANNISISGIAKLDTKDISDKVSQKLGGIFYGGFGEKVLLCSLENLINIGNYFNQFIDDDPDDPDDPGGSYPPFFYIRFLSSIFFDTSKLDAFNVGKFTSQLKIIENKLIQSLIEYEGVYIASNIKEQLDEASGQLFFIKSMFLIMSIPALGISLFLVIFSFGLIGPRKENLVRIMKTRGMSSAQVLTILTMETLLSTVFALLIGIIAGYFLAFIILQTSSFMTFNEDVKTVYLILTDLKLIAIASVVLSFDFNLYNTMNLSKVNILTDSDPSETKEPKWQRYYIDILFIVIGLIGWFSSSYLATLGGAENGFIIILFLIAPVAPFAVSIGGILLVSRIFPYLIEFFSSLLWYTTGGLLAYASKALIRRKHTASRVMGLIAISLVFITVSAVMSSTIENNEDDRKLYEAGADMAIYEINISNQTLLNRLNNFTEITWTPLVKIWGYDNIASRRYEMIAINSSTYADVAYWRDDFSEKPLEELMNYCKNDSILINKKDMNLIDFEIGEKITLSREMYNDTTGTSEFLQTTVTIGETFDYWPNFLTSIEYEDLDSTQLNIVLDLQFYFDNNVSINGLSYSYYDALEEDSIVYLKIKEGVNRTLLKEQLMNTFNDTNIYIIDPFADRGYSFGADVIRRTVYSVLNANMIVAMTAAILSLSFFAFMVLAERGRELGLYKALGMVRKQLFLVFVTETLVILFMGLLIGNLLGQIVAQMFLALFAIGSPIPPLLTYIPFMQLFIINSILLVGALLAAAIPALIISHLETGKILRRE
ncbi:MAG: FtsX-like permease family protein [Candidatus Kariarchaeaceae archaeon]